MKVSLNLEKTQRLKKIVYQQRSQWGTEPHRTDAVSCPVKAYCRMTGMVGLPHTKVVENWIVGEVLHQIVQNAFPKENTEVTRTRDDIFVMDQNPAVHFDLVWDDVFTELKSTTLSMLTKEDILPEYLEQLRFGFIFNDATLQNLVTFDIVNKVMLVWDVEIEESERKKADVDYQIRMSLIEFAVENKNPHVLEPHKNECRWCQYNYKASDGGCPYIT